MSCTKRIISFDFDIVVKKTSQQWFGVVCTLIDNDICHYSGQNVVVKSTKKKENIVVIESADQAKPRLIY